MRLSRNTSANIGVCRAVLIVSSVLFCQVSGLAQKAPFASTNKKVAAAPAVSERAETRGNGGSIWLSLDVVEHQYNASGSEIGKEKYRSDVDLQVIDSTSNRQIAARSGETIQLQPKRTYYIMLADVPQRYGMVTKIAGQQTQILRTPKSSGSDDVMFERKFVLNSRPGAASARELNTGVGVQGSGSKMPRKLPPPEIDDMPPSTYSRPSVGIPPIVSSKIGNSMSAPNYYVIQYCSLKNQADALEARSFLMRNGIRDARVEIYVDRFGEAYYRLRSGSYNDLTLAKMTIEQNLWKNRKFLGLKQKPIIVKAGV